MLLYIMLYIVLAYLLLYIVLAYLMLFVCITIVNNWCGGWNVDFGYKG